MLQEVLHHLLLSNDQDQGKCYVTYRLSLQKHRFYFLRSECHLLSVREANDGHAPTDDKHHCSQIILWNEFLVEDVDR